MKPTRRGLLAGATLLPLTLMGQVRGAAGDGSTAPDLRLRSIRQEHPRIIATPEALARMDAALKTNLVARNWRSLFEQRMREAFFHDKGLPPLAYTDKTKDVFFRADPAPAAPAGRVEDLGTPSEFLDLSNEFEVPTPVDEPDTSQVFKYSFNVKADGALDYARVALTRMHALGLLALMKPEPEYVERAKLELLAICRLRGWGTKILAAATFAHAAAIGYDWLHASLSESERAFVEKTILDRGITRGLAEFDAYPQPAWLTSRAILNWNVVCNAAMMVTALSLFERDRAACTRLFNLSYHAILRGLANYAPDGSWKHEGPNYWHLATEHAVYMLDALDTALGTDLFLSDVPGLRETGTFRLHVEGPSKRLFNYGDSASSRRELWWMLWLARRYGR
ncbi:MAG TPA: hypothetical protein VHN20_13005, partial [Beijerinckiaceae bacterium]|nr:hypothetical protein [Beijerinckiaceae bacterium]